MIRTKFSIFSSIRRRCLAMWRDRTDVAAIVVAIFVPVLVVVTAQWKTLSNKGPKLSARIRKNISVSVRHALGNKIQPHRAFRLDPTLSGTSPRVGRQALPTGHLSAPERRVLAKNHSFCAYERDQLSPGVPTAMLAGIDSKVTATLADR